MLISREMLTVLRAVRHRLSATDSTPPTLRALALSMGVSQFQLIRQFRAVFGETPRQAQINARLAEARRLLATTDLSVTDVCMEVGFSSLGSFSRLFNLRVGESPSAYRRRVLEQEAENGPPAHPGCLSLLAHLPADAQLRRSADDAEGSTLEP